MTAAIFSFVVVDHDAKLDPTEVVSYAHAQQRQVLEHWVLHHQGMGLVRSATAHPLQDGEIEIQLIHEPTMDGALGYHDRKPDGTPVIYVFVGLCKQLGVSWTSVASHEVLETLADAFLNESVQNMTDGKFYALEVCDAVENTSYKIDGVELSNFCTMAWFEPPAKPTAETKYDYLGKCKHAFEVIEGGYAQYFDASKGWVQLGTSSAYRTVLAEMGISRGARRQAAHAIQQSQAT